LIEEVVDFIERYGIGFSGHGEVIDSTTGKKLHMNHLICMLRKEIDFVNTTQLRIAVEDILRYVKDKYERGSTEFTECHTIEGYL
jgi:hypothetical protein